MAVYIGQASIDENGGIKFDTATIENMIEASVLLLHNELYGTQQEETK